MRTLYIDQSLNSTGVLLHDRETDSMRFYLLVPDDAPKWLRELPYVMGIVTPNFTDICCNNLGSLNKAVGQITTIDTLVSVMGVDEIVVESLAYGCKSKTKDVLSYLFNRIVELSFRRGIRLTSYSPIETGKVVGWKPGEGSSRRKEAVIAAFKSACDIAPYLTCKNKLDNLADAFALYLKHKKHT